MVPGIECTVKENGSDNMNEMERCARAGVVPVVVLERAQDALPTAEALLGGGIDVMEITMRTPAALEAIRTVSRQLPEMLVGAGTVLTAEQSRACADAGAAFLVSPGFSREMVRWCVDRSLAVLPGCVTPTEIMVNLHLAGSVWGLGIQYWGFCTPMAIFIYYNFMDTIPKEMDESAKMDGASTLYSFFHVIFPLLRPVTVTVLVLDIMWIWNDLILPLLMVNTNVATRTLTLGVYSYIGHFVTNWDYALCAMVMSVGPSIVIFILLQKYIVDGVVAGAIKG